MAAMAIFTDLFFRLLFQIFLKLRRHHSVGTAGIVRFSGVFKARNEFKIRGCRRRIALCGFRERQVVLFLFSLFAAVFGHLLFDFGFE